MLTRNVAQTQRQMHTSSIVQGLRRLGPYLLVELLLPGGTLLAVLLYLCQHGRFAFSSEFAERGLAFPHVAVLYSGRNTRRPQISGHRQFLR